MRRLRCVNSNLPPSATGCDWLDECSRRGQQSPAVHPNAHLKLGPTPLVGWCASAGVAVTFFPFSQLGPNGRHPRSVTRSESSYGDSTLFTPTRPHQIPTAARLLPDQRPSTRQDFYIIACHCPAIWPPDPICHSRSQQTPSGSNPRRLPSTSYLYN